MILWLYIKNVALIEEAEIELGKGLNILSGETGAGKSMVIDSINFVLGERASKDFIRFGETRAQVQACFLVEDETTLKELRELDIETEDGTIVIQRTMNIEGKSTARINGTAVTAGMLKKVCENLVDVHGQHEHQSLLNQSKHITMLDKFCAEYIECLKKELSFCMDEYKSVLSKLKDVSGDKDEREEKIEKLRFRIDEIEDAMLKNGEEEQFNERKTYLNNMERIIKLSSEAVRFLCSGSDDTNSALDNINETVRLFSSLKELDEKTNEMYEGLCTLSNAAEEIGQQVKKYRDSLDSDPEEIDEIEERLDYIYRLKKKYGNSIEEVLETGQKMKEELNFIENSEEQREQLEKERKQVYKNIKDICDRMTIVRKEKGKEISKEIETELRDLEMKNVKFQIVVSPKDTFNAKGCDNVEFMLSPNFGEEMKPLVKIASGGEMSRVMLALKAVVADKDTIDTLIFDEIDTGVSGNTATKVGEKMGMIARDKQIICITHLPQIAAMADTHFLIEKTVEGDRTFTHISALDEEGEIDELSRLIGGNSGSNAVLEAAKEMKTVAKKFKSNS